MLILGDGAYLIKSMAEEVRSHNETECRTVDCVQNGTANVSVPSKPIDREVITSDQREPGISCTVEIYTSTGISESEHTRIARYEGKYQLSEIFGSVDFPS